ncbi:MAG: phosphoribosylanthranilate isomerase [Polyangiaceae bacterium]|nr:phosphoribosylanthranilate isomerase [Polyangiaceae bacterium]
MTVGIKICGLCEVGDAVAAVEAGATAVGLNLIASSKRFIELPLAAAIVAEVGAQVRTVVVVADLTAAEIESIRQRVRPNYVQLHGSESAALLAAVLPGAYKAIRIADRGDVAAASEFAGEELLVDAKVPGALGGTGTSFDWSLVSELSRQRSMWLAGGLTPDNVAEAVRQVAPYGVDTASGVEVSGQARRKDPSRMKDFVQAVRDLEVAS